VPGRPAPPRRSRRRRCRTGRERDDHEGATQATIVLGRQAINQRNRTTSRWTVASYILAVARLTALTRACARSGLAYAVLQLSCAWSLRRVLHRVIADRTARSAKVSEIVREELARMTASASRTRAGAGQSVPIGSFPVRWTRRAGRRLPDRRRELGLGLDYADRYRELISRVTGDDVIAVAAGLPAAGLQPGRVGAAP